MIDVTNRALADGADEIDAVLPYHAWLHGDEEAAADLLDRVRETVNEHSDLSHGDGLFKVIIETGALPDRAAIDRATHFVIAHGADFVKTSTGKIEVSATPEAAEIVLEAIEVSGCRGASRRPAGSRRSPTPASTSSWPTGSWDPAGSLRTRSASAPAACSTPCWLTPIERYLRFPIWAGIVPIPASGR